MLATEKLDAVTSLAMLLSNPLRLAIVQRLVQGPCIVGELVDHLKEQQATVSKQLALLRTSGLLKCCAEGRCRRYELAHPERVAAVIDALDALGTDTIRQAVRCASLRTPQAGRPTTRHL